MKKRKLKTVLRQADDKTLETIAQHPVTDEATKKRIYKAVEKSVEIVDTSQDAVTETYQAEIRHTSWMQYASMVACVAVIAGTAGIGFHLKNNAPKTQPIQTATEITAENPQPEELAPPEIENDIPVETIFVPQAPIEYDLTTKEGIYGKMLNSVDYFDKVFVAVIEMETAEENLITVMNLWADVTTGQSLEYVKRDNVTEENGIPDLIALNRPPLVEEDEYYGHFTNYCDGKSIYDISMNEKNYRLISYSPSHCRDDSPIDAEAVRQWFLETYQQENDEQQNYVRFAETEEEPLFRNDATSSRVGAKWLQPYSFATYALSDFDKWELGGKVGYIGRECIEIAGDAYGYNWYPEGSTFTAYIDEETGCLLRNVVYDADGNLLDWQVTMAISFDEDAEIEFPNLDEYTEIKNEPIDMEEYYAYKTNSKGETYGIGGQYEFSWENYDLLPDLILFDYDKRNDMEYYQRKDEIFEMFPEDPERHNYRQEFNKLEGDIPIEVNMYDCEGNFAYTITYYHEP